MATTALRDRKQRQDVTEFDALVATPANLATGFNLPANAELYVSTSSVVAVNTKLLDCGGRSLYVGPGVAGLKHHIGYYERSENVKKAAAAPGTVSVYIRDGIGKLFKIAEG